MEKVRDSESTWRGRGLEKIYREEYGRGRARTKERNREKRMTGESKEGRRNMVEGGKMVAGTSIPVSMGMVMGEESGYCMGRKVMGPFSWMGLSKW